MRSLIIVAITVFLFISASAQERDQDREQVRLQDREYYMFQDGQMHRIREGSRTQLQTQVRLNNGTIIEPNGYFQVANRKRKLLRNGECIDFEGNRYRNQERYQKMITQLAQNNHFIMQNGNVFQVQNGRKSRIQNQVRLDNNTTIDQDGTVRNENRKEYRLREGECLDNEGKRYRSRERFRLMLDRKERNPKVNKKTGGKVKTKKNKKG